MARIKSPVSMEYVHIHIMLTPYENNQMRAMAEAYNLSITDLIRHFISSKNPDDLKEHELEQKMNRAKLDAIKYENEYTAFIRAKEEQEKIRRDIENDQEYAIVAFKLMYEILNRHEKRVVADPAIITKAYGISFNIKKCNEDWDLIGELPDGELISYISLKKVANVKASKNVEIINILRKKREVKMLTEKVKETGVEYE